MQARYTHEFFNKYNDNYQRIQNTKYIISRHFSNNIIDKYNLEEKESNWAKSVS